MLERLPRPVLARDFGWVAIILALLGAYQLTDIANPDALNRGLFLLAAAVLVSWAALALKPLSVELLIPLLPTEPSLCRRHWLSIGVGIAALLLFGEINGNLLGLRQFLPTDEHIQFSLLCIGCAGLAWGFSGGRLIGSWRAEWLEIAGVIALTLLALALRATNLESAIPGFVDEVSFTAPIPAFEFRDDVLLLQPINSVAAFPRLYVYFEWISVRIFGRDLNGFRMVSALFGTLTVPALYWLCKHLFAAHPAGRKIAVIAAALLATLPLHIQLSRVGMNNVGDPLFGVLAFALIARGLRYGGRANFAVAGVALGLAQYFHEAGRLTLPVIAALWMLWIGVRASQRHLWRQLFITAVCAVLVSVPLYYTMYAFRTPFAPRAQDVGLKDDYWSARGGDIGLLIEGATTRTKNALARLLHQPEKVLYYAGETPYILYFLTPLLTIGLAYALWHWSRAEMLLLLLWLAIPMGGIIVFLAEILSPRAIIFLPPLTILMALGLVYGLQLALESRPRLLRWLTVALVIVLCAAQTIYYFSFHLPTFTRQMHTLQPWQQFIFQTRTLPRNTQIHIISAPKHDRNYLSQVVRFLAGDSYNVETHEVGEITPAYLATLPRNVNQAFVLQMPNPEVADVLRAFFPDLTGPFLKDQPYLVDRWYVIYLLPSR